MTEPPTTVSVSSTRTHPVVYAGIGVVALVITVLAVTAFSTAEKPKFDFVGSAIRPAREGSPQAPAEDAGLVQPPAPAADEPAAPKVAAVDRKIIFTATLDVTVPNVQKADEAVLAAVATHKGYVAQADVRSEGDDRSRATYTLRVPSDGLRPLLSALAKLGTPGRSLLDSKDVTEEYVDTQSRVRNLKQEEETLNRLMKEKAANVDEMLAIRRHIQPVREGVERAEGRLTYLATMSSLSTVTLNLRETPAEKAAPRPPGSPRDA